MQRLLKRFSWFLVVGMLTGLFTVNSYILLYFPQIWNLTSFKTLVLKSHCSVIYDSWASEHLLLFNATKKFLNSQNSQQF